MVAVSAWRLANLAAHLVERPVAMTISRETLRRILRDGKVSWQTTTTWKASTDPDFIARCTGFWPCTTPHRPTDR
ncbi:hypothetical protein [Streptomyces sp. NPDC006335]|uniref:hypothetical protein n=1 Tax=Streptomyces sp. NPDC006335 TaxID=3156895 RepID=UPI0033B11312